MEAGMKKPGFESPAGGEEGWSRLTTSTFNSKLLMLTSRPEWP